MSVNANEAKALLESIQAAFKSLKDTVQTHDAEVKEFGAARMDTKAALDKINERMDALETQAAEMARKAAASAVPMKKDADREITIEDQAIEKFIRFGTKAGFARFDEAERKAFDAMRTKALSEGNDAKGGIVVPEDFQLEVLKKIPNFSNVGSAVGTQTTGRDVLRWPSIPYATDDIRTSGVAVVWEDETETVTETDFSMGSTAIAIKKARAIIKVSNDLIEDQAVDVIALLSNLLAEAFGIEDDAVLTNGSGPRKPEGFMVNADIATVNSGASGAFTYDGIIDLCYALPEQYAGNAQFMCRRSAVGALRKLKDSTGQPLWQPSVQLGVPATLNGYAIRVNEHMPAVAAAAKALIFGDFKRLYMKAERKGMSLKRVDELYAATDETGFIARRRMGGKVVAPWAAKTQTLST